MRSTCGALLALLATSLARQAKAKRQCAQYNSAAQCTASECAWCVGARAAGSCTANVTACPGQTRSVALLSVSGTSLVFNGAPVFLSGANLAWIDYGDDFGNNQTNGKLCALRSYVRNVSAAGGNTLRVWLFVDGHAIPAFNPSGFVIGTDNANSLARELVALARYAASRNVFLNLCLWNGAVKPPPAVLGLLGDDAKLQSFFDNALAPLVRALQGEARVRPPSFSKSAPRARSGHPRAALRRQHRAAALSSRVPPPRAPPTSPAAASNLRATPPHPVCLTTRPVRRRAGGGGMGNHERAGGKCSHRVGHREPMLRHAERPRGERRGVDGGEGSDEDAAGLCEQACRGYSRRRRQRSRHPRLVEPVRCDGRHYAAGR